MAVKCKIKPMIKRWGFFSLGLFFPGWGVKSQANPVPPFVNGERGVVKAVLTLKVLKHSFLRNQMGFFPALFKPQEVYS